LASILLLLPALLPASLLLSVSPDAVASVPDVADILATENVFLLITDLQMWQISYC
jgi:hypothetical protein